MKRAAQNTEAANQDARRTLFTKRQAENSGESPTEPQNPKTRLREQQPENEPIRRTEAKTDLLQLQGIPGNPEQSTIGSEAQNTDVPQQGAVDQQGDGTLQVLKARRRGRHKEPREVIVPLQSKTTPHRTT